MENFLAFQRSFFVLFFFTSLQNDEQKAEKNFLF
jgi:hypothetical protein